MHNKTYSTVGSTPLNSGSARRRGSYLQQHTANVTERAITPSEGFESAIPVIEQPQTGALDRKAFGIAQYLYDIFINKPTNICQLILYSAKISNLSHNCSL